ncbi:SnoaL-like protein [Herbihabitans rhizosphaerae]|uniref:SnoaL-like protein n=1 Tax=Herbihabitans rhizosphaerae TaxID=1872711 RepID=A0A4Q7L5S3_9PSEU|nr:nuclear transport factor 2 family protein [Herbihabitans rhizosphaerae]RZS44170.1 SnoaL-like protein [Herbihabitans rhizosphaerae]
MNDLADRVELSDLVNRLGRWLDDKEFDDPTLVTADITASTPNGDARGVAEVAALASAAHPPNVQTHHLITNPVIDLDGDRAVVRANVIAVFDDGDKPQLTGGRYRFETTRTGSGWKLSRLEVQPRWRFGT